MIKKLFLFIFVMLFIQTVAQANSTTVTIKVTMPDVLILNTDNDLDKSAESQGCVHKEMTSIEKTIRNGKLVIIKSIVSK